MNRRTLLFGSKTGATLVFASTALCATLAVAAASSAWWEHVPAKEHTRANPMANQPEAVTAGGLIYQGHCLQCHKADAQGDGRKKPSLRTDRIRAVTDGDLEWFLRQGDLGHGMPSWSSLPEAQRWQLIAYLRSLH
jgi:mono/diheme cytochrome c family protein